MATQGKNSRNIVITEGKTEEQQLKIEKSGTYKCSGNTRYIK